MKGPSLVADAFENVVYVVVLCSHSAEVFFCSRRGEFVVVIKVYGACIEAIVPSAWGEVMCSSSCDIIGTFCQR